MVTISSHSIERIYISFSREKYESVFDTVIDTADDGQSETKREVNVTPRYVFLSIKIKNILS